MGTTGLSVSTCASDAALRHSVHREPGPPYRSRRPSMSGFTPLSAFPSSLLPARSNPHTGGFPRPPLPARPHPFPWESRHIAQNEHSLSRLARLSQARRLAKAKLSSSSSSPPAPKVNVKGYNPSALDPHCWEVGGWESKQSPPQPPTGGGLEETLPASSALPVGSMAVVASPAHSFASAGVGGLPGSRALVRGVPPKP